MDFNLLYNIVLITFLGLLLAFNPMLVVVDVLLVLRSKRPVLNSVFLATGFVAAIVVMLTIAIALIDPDSQVSLRKISEDLELPAAINILAGSVLLGYGAKRYRDKAKRKPKTKQSRQIEIPQKPLQIFLFGLLKTPLSATNIFAVLIMARLATTNNWDPALAIAAAIWLLLVGVIPLAAVVYYHQFKHHRLLRLNQRIDQALAYDFYDILTYGLVAVGAIFAVGGFFEILSR